MEGNLQQNGQLEGQKRGKGIKEMMCEKTVYGATRLVYGRKFVSLHKTTDDFRQRLLRVQVKYP
jgi:hypothetical protein